MTKKTAKGTVLQMLKLKGKDYMPVAQRLVWFREEKPDWTIETQIVKVDDQVAIVKATIKNTDLDIASAHKVEHKAHFADYSTLR